MEGRRLSGLFLNPPHDLKPDISLRRVNRGLWRNIQGRLFDRFPRALYPETSRPCKIQIGNPVTCQQEDCSDEKGPGARIAQDQDREAKGEKYDEDKRGPRARVR